MYLEVRIHHLFSTLTVRSDLSDVIVTIPGNHTHYSQIIHN